MKHPYLSECITRIERVSQEAREIFGGLNEEQLNWKPNPDDWSIGQCLDHLMVSNSQYFPIFDDILRGKKTARFWEKVPVLPGMWGGMLVKALSPHNRRRSKTMNVFEPRESDIPTTIVSDFETHNQKLVNYFERLDSIDNHRKIIITSPVSNLVTYSLRNTFRILTNHEERHLLQAKRVMELPEFPYFE